jgi:hypothetical protein
MGVRAEKVCALDANGAITKCSAFRGAANNADVLGHVARAQFCVGEPLRGPRAASLTTVVGLQCGDMGITTAALSTPGLNSKPPLDDDDFIEENR